MWSKAKDQPSSVILSAARQQFLPRMFHFLKSKNIVAIYTEQKYSSSVKTHSLALVSGHFHVKIFVGHYFWPPPVSFPRIISSHFSGRVSNGGHYFGHFHGRIFAGHYFWPPPVSLPGIRSFPPVCRLLLFALFPRNPHSSATTLVLFFITDVAYIVIIQPFHDQQQLVGHPNGQCLKSKAPMHVCQLIRLYCHV